MNLIYNVSNIMKDFELRQDPVIARVNEFTEQGAEKLASDISDAHNTGQDIIPIVIDSYGGEVYSLMSMIGSINSSRLPVATIVVGKAMSCGAILTSFGSKGHRYVDKDATIMIHDVSSFAFGKVEDLKADAREAERLNKKVYEMMADNCDKPNDYFLNIIHDKGHANWFLTAEEAVSHGLCDHVKTPNININVDVSINLS